MDKHDSQPTAGAIRPDPNTPDGRDLLISRVIDAEASADDWSAFRTLAESDPDVWRDLADAQQQNEVLGEAFRETIHVADSVDLPELIADDRPFQRRLDSIGRWGGWAAAAAVLLVWSTGFRGTAPGQGLGVQGAGYMGGPALAEASPDQAMERYIEAGRRAGSVVGEVPDRLVIETIPQRDGSIEVVYLRQIVERRITDQVYRESMTDSGATVPVRIPAAQVQRRKSF
ncbi:MAG: hypothetical protein AAGA55_03365 [Planctomycetota bacterium]